MADAPKTASAIVNGAYITTTTVDASNLDSTDGIRNAVKANTAAIKMLADHIDGIHPVPGSTTTATVTTDPVTGIRTSTDPVTKIVTYTDKNGVKVDRTGKPI